MLALGIIGEYIVRLHRNVNRKPQYTVRQVLGRDAATEPKYDVSIVAAQLETAAVEEEIEA